MRKNYPPGILKAAAKSTPELAVRDKFGCAGQHPVQLPPEEPRRLPEAHAASHGHGGAS